MDNKGMEDVAPYLRPYFHSFFPLRYLCIDDDDDDDDEDEHEQDKVEKKDDDDDDDDVYDNVDDNEHVAEVVAEDVAEAADDEDETDEDEAEADGNGDANHVDDDGEDHPMKYRSKRVMVDGDYLSYVGDKFQNVGVYVAGEKLTPSRWYFEVEILDPVREGTMAVGLCCKTYSLGAHIGFGRVSVGLSTEESRIYINGKAIQEIYLKCVPGDRICCGVRFEQALESKEEPPDTVVPVFFYINDREVCTVPFTLPESGVYPALSMQCEGEMFKLVEGFSWMTKEDCVMDVVNYEKDWYRLNDIRLDGQVLEYIGEGKSINDVGFAQAQAPLTTNKHYFEIEIIDPGENCYIAIGLTKRNYPRQRHPGWDKGSIGYHADDGKIFVGKGFGDPFGPRCHKGDRMGCGIWFPVNYNCDYDSDGCYSDDSCLSPDEESNELENELENSDSDDEHWWQYCCCSASEGTVKVFFTRNGNGLGHRDVCIPKGGYFPTIGMLSANEKVRVDFHPLTG